MVEHTNSAGGQPLSERGIQTRQRILAVLGAAIERQGLRGIRLADIAREVGFKPPAFYQYFSDLDEAILALCEEVGDFVPSFEIDAGSWGDDHLRGTRPFVERFLQYWDEHRSLLTARHMAILSGDGRYQRVANDAFRPIAETLQAKIDAAQRDGRIDEGIEPIALAAVLNLMIDGVAMAAPAINRYWGADNSDALIDAVAFAFDRVLGVGIPGA